MFVTKKRLSRRTLLRGAGAAIALPLLDSMIPAATALAATAAQPKTRLGCIYVPHGATGSASSAISRTHRWRLGRARTPAAPRTTFARPRFF